MSPNLCDQKSQKSIEREQVLSSYFWKWLHTDSIQIHMMSYWRELFVCFLQLAGHSMHRYCRIHLFRGLFYFIWIDVSDKKCRRLKCPFCSRFIAVVFVEPWSCCRICNLFNMTVVALICCTGNWFKRNRWTQSPN